ncbi:MAG: proton-conducting transporter transmembrane domain-containing protein, partial [Myxococcaceae bacterium]
FFSAGSVLHGAGTKDLEKLGGLMKRMPKTGLAMLLGAVAIAGLPPLNGFVSEWLIYLGLIGGGLSGGGAPGILALMGVGLLSFVGGLTALCFVRLSGVALLGEARSASAREAHESSPWMTTPILVLAGLAVLVSVLPGPISFALAGVTGQLFGEGAAAPLTAGPSPLATLGTVNFFLWVALGTVGLLLFHLTRNPAPPVGTWDCGYAAPSSRMQYGAASFSEFFERLLPWILRARIEKRTPTTYFPADGGFASDRSDPITRGVYEPFFAGLGDRFARLRWLQQGSLHVYLLYILVMLMLTLAWASWHSWGSG